MQLNKRPPTPEQKHTVFLVERLIRWGLSLNRACHHHGVSPATFYRHGGHHPIDLVEMRKARRAR